MTEHLGENICLKDHSTKEDIPEETTKTLFSPKIKFSLDDNEREEPSVDENKQFRLNKSILEIPSVLLSPCSRRASKSEQNLRSGSPIELLVPPSPLNVPRKNTASSLALGKQRQVPAFPRTLSLSLPSTPSSSTDVIFNSSPFNGYAGDHSCDTPQDGEIHENQCSEVDNGSHEYHEWSFVSHDFHAGSLRDCAACLRAPDRSMPDQDSEETRLKLPVAVSTLNLHQNTSCCRRRPRQLCCLLGTSYTALSTPSSECSSRGFSNQNFELNVYGKDERLLPYEFHSCSENTDESDFPPRSTSGATESSLLGLDEQSFCLPRKHGGVYKQHSRPSLRLKKAHTLPSDWKTGQRSSNSENDFSKVGKSHISAESALKVNTASSTFLHPDSARHSSSFEGSAVSLPQSLSSKTFRTSRKRACLGYKRPRLQHQPFSIHSMGSSGFEDPSDRSERSTMRSFLSLISPSRLLSKLSLSKHSVRSSDSRSHRKKRQTIDFPDDDKLVTLNVSGRRFQIRDYFLSVYPNTLLGGKGRSLFYDEVRNEFFFDRDPDFFRYIWNFYHSGQLHCPGEECVQSFLDEVAFFGLDITMLCNCCWHETFEPAYEKLSKRREEKEAAEKEAAKAMHILAPDATLREKVWVTMQEPSYSFIAKMFYLISVFVISVSVVANTTETITCESSRLICQEENEKTYFYLDTVCVGFFTSEYVMRLIVCPSRLKFIINYMSIIDVLSILPYYIDLLLEYLAVGTSLGMDALVVLRVLRILRVFKLLRHSKRLKKLTQSVKDSATELGLISFVYLVMVILFSSIIYFAELSDDTQFSSIPEAMWYAVITSTTAG